MPYKDLKKRKEYQKNYRKIHKVNYSQNKHCKCGKLISNSSNQCSECYFKNRDIKGKNNPNFDNHKLSGKNNPMFGKHHSKKAKQKIRKKLKGKKLSKKRIESISKGHIGIFAGEKHPNWQGGKSFEPYPLGWTNTFKEQIRFRDGYKCQICGCPEVECNRKLHVHHKDYDKDNINPENLTSLCQSCHSKTNYNRDYWYAYFQYKLKEEKNV